MKKLSMVLLLCTAAFLLFSCSTANTSKSALANNVVYTDQQLKVITDSILVEGTLLYQYEKAAWIGTDLAREKANIRNTFRSYLVYQIEDTIKIIITDKNNQCIYDMSFINDFSYPTHESMNVRELTAQEQKLSAIRTKLLEEVSKRKYKVQQYDGYSLNMILLPYNTGYKF